MEKEMKKYQIVELTLNEYVGDSKEKLITEIEAFSKDEAMQIAKLCYPDLFIEIKENN